MSEAKEFRDKLAKLSGRYLVLEYAAQSLLDSLTDLVNSGDSGHWDPKTESYIRDLKAALKKGKRWYQRMERDSRLV